MQVFSRKSCILSEMEYNKYNYRFTVMKYRKVQYNLGHSVFCGGSDVFSEVNSLIFLLIFLIYFLICVAVCRKKAGLYDCRDAGLALVKGLLFCGVAAMLLTVITIYIWFLVLILMAIVIKYVCGLAIQKSKKTAVIILLLVWMVLVGAAGLQLMWNMQSEEEDDALEVQEPEDSTMLNSDTNSVVQCRK